MSPSSCLTIRSGPRCTRRESPRCRNRFRRSARAHSNCSKRACTSGRPAIARRSCSPPASSCAVPADLRETRAHVRTTGSRRLPGHPRGFFPSSLRLRPHRPRGRVVRGRRASAAGSEFRAEPGTRRLANLVDKGEIFREVFANDEILRYIGHMLRPRFKLSSLNARSANPHEHGHQPLHVDQGLLPDAGGAVVANVVWMLDDFTPENGAMRAVPRTHLSGQRPPGSAGRRQRRASGRSVGDGARRDRLHHECAPVARRHRESHGPRRAARFIPSTAASTWRSSSIRSGSCRRMCKAPCPRRCGHCWRWTIL